MKHCKNVWKQISELFDHCELHMEIFKRNIRKITSKHEKCQKITFKIIRLSDNLRMTYGIY